MIEFTFQPYDNPITDHGWILENIVSTQFKGKLVWVKTTYRGSADTQAGALFAAECLAKSLGGKIVTYGPRIHEC